MFHQNCFDINSRNQTLTKTVTRICMVTLKRFSITSISSVTKMRLNSMELNYDKVDFKLKVLSMQLKWCKKLFHHLNSIGACSHALNALNWQQECFENWMPTFSAYILTPKAFHLWGPIQHGLCSSLSHSYFMR